MTSTLCQSAALDRFIAFVIAIVKIILMIAKNGHSSLHARGASCHETERRFPVLRSAPSRLMAAKIETMGRSCPATVLAMSIHTDSKTRATCRYRGGAGLNAGNSQVRRAWGLR
jgi:hypothetical protein